MNTDRGRNSRRPVLAGDSTDEGEMSVGSQQHKPLELDIGGPLGSKQPLEFRSPDGKRKYVAVRLHDDPWKEGQTARWSLLVPEDGGQAGAVEITLTRAQGAMHISLSPLRLDRQELARVVLETQKLTLPSGVTTMSLEELEKLAGSRKEAVAR